MQHADLFLRLTSRPDLLERLAARPEALKDVMTELARMKPELGRVLSGLRRFTWTRPLHIAV